MWENGPGGGLSVPSFLPLIFVISEPAKTAVSPIFRR